MINFIWYPQCHLSLNAGPLTGRANHPIAINALLSKHCKPDILQTVKLQFRLRQVKFPSFSHDHVLVLQAEQRLLSAAISVKEHEIFKSF